MGSWGKWGQMTYERQQSSFVLHMASLSNSVRIQVYRSGQWYIRARMTRPLRSLCRNAGHQGQQKQQRQQVIPITSSASSDTTWPSSCLHQARQLDHVTWLVPEIHQMTQQLPAQATPVRPCDTTVPWTSYMLFDQTSESRTRQAVVRMQTCFKKHSSNNIAKTWKMQY